MYGRDEDKYLIQNAVLIQLWDLNKLNLFVLIQILVIVEALIVFYFLACLIRLVVEYNEINVKLNLIYGLIFTLVLFSESSTSISS